MAKVIGIAGSPRKNGNSTTLMKAVLAAAEAAGAETSTVHLNELTFRGCQGCDPCTPDLTCRVTDELTGVLKAVREADGWVLAAPIYYDGVSGQMKLFFDRLRHVTKDAGDQHPMLPGRRAAAVIVTYEDKPRQDYFNVARVLANYLAWMGDFGEVAILSAARLGPADAAAGRADLLQEAGEIGRQLMDRLAEA